MQAHPNEYLLFAGSRMLQDDIQFGQDESYDQMFEYDDEMEMESFG